MLVVGAGPTGLTMAVELQRRGIDCRLVEKDDSTVETSRALAIQPRTLQVFEQIGVLDDVLAEGMRLTGATMYHGDRESVRLQMDDLQPPSPYPLLWWLLQNRTERILTDRFERLGGEVEFDRDLLLFAGVEDAETIRHVARSVESEYLRPSLVVPAGTRPLGLGDDVVVPRDDGNRLHDLYDARRPELYLVRPDDYVGFRCHPARLAPLRAYLDGRVCLSPTSVA